MSEDKRTPHPLRYRRYRGEASLPSPTGRGRGPRRKAWEGEGPFFLQHLKNAAITLLPLIAFLLFWQWFSGGSDTRQFLFASPSLIWEKAAALYPQKQIWIDTGTTALETFLGLACGSVAGLAFGLLMWGNGRFESIARPYVVVLGSIPVFAIAPVLIIWFGIGLLSKVIMAAFGVFLVTIIQSYEGAKAAGDAHLFFARSLGAKQRDIIIKIIVPGSLRWVLTGFKINIGFALLGAFIGEFVSAEAGLGHYILKSGSLYDVPGVMFGLLNLSALALLFSAAVRLAEKTFLPWLQPD